MKISINETENGWLVEVCSNAFTFSNTYVFTSANKLIQFIMGRIYESETRLTNKGSKKIQQPVDVEKVPVGILPVSPKPTIFSQSNVKYPLNGNPTGAVGESSREVDNVSGYTPTTISENGEDSSKKQDTKTLSNK